MIYDPRRMLRRALAAPFATLLTLATLTLGCGDDGSPLPPPPPVLVFVGDRAVDDGEWIALEAALQTTATARGLPLEFVADAAALCDETLGARAGLVLACPATQRFDDVARGALTRFVERGGYVLALDGALRAESEWWWSRRLFGALSTTEWPFGQYEIATVAAADPSLAECVFAQPLVQAQPDSRTHPLLELGDAYGRTPVAWERTYDGGGCVALGLGGTAEVHRSAPVRRVLARAFAAMGTPLRGVEVTRPDDDAFDVDVVLDGLEDPIEIAPLPSGDVLVLERKGALKLYSAASDRVRVIHRFEVACRDESGTHANECGGLGLAVGPNHGVDRFVYVYWSPREPALNRLSRFTLQGDGDAAKLVDERVLLEVGTDRDETTCHEGGSLAFARSGELFLSTGDNTNPFASDGFAPIDEREDRTEWDAQRSAGNSNDLRGSILRIRPNEDGTVAIPDGNLWPPGTAFTRPEIFVKGCRNPYRISVDPLTGDVWWGDVGPDAGDDGHGDPRGVDTLNRARRAGYFGWPFARGGRFYRDRDFASGERGESFADLLVNDSPRNTGLERLPSPTRPFFAYPYGRSSTLPELNDGGRNAMAGPWIHQSLHGGQFPAWFDRVMLFYDWARATFFWLKFDEAGELDGVHRFLAHVSIPHPIDVELGKDGALWILDYGTNWWDNVDGRLLRVRFSSFDKRPKVAIDATPTTGGLPLAVRFSSAGTHDPDGDDARLRYAWDFGDGTASSEASPRKEYAKPGAFDVTLTVTDAAGREGKAMTSIVAGNTAPEVTLFAPATFRWDAPLTYTVEVSDVEDGRANGGPLAAEDALRRADLVAVYVESGDPDDAADVEPDPLLPGMDPRLKGTALLKRSGCIACHHPEQPSVGPAYRQVADALRALDESRRAEEIARLIAKVRAGGAGRYGSVAMPPHLHVPEPSIANMVDAIAALGSDDGLRGKDGTVVIPAAPETAKDAHGIYVLRASYTDRGAAGVAALTRSSKPVVVRAAPLEFALPTAAGEELVIAALDAEIEGTHAEREDECIGSWSDVDTAFTFALHVPRAGAYDVALRYAAPEDQVGSQLVVECDATTFAFTTEATPSWTEFRERELGVLEFSQAGVATLRVKATSRAAAYIANLEALRLRAR